MREKTCSPCDPSLSLSLSLWPLHSSVETKVLSFRVSCFQAFDPATSPCHHAYKYIACFNFIIKKSFLLYITKTFHLLYIRSLISSSYVKRLIRLITLISPLWLLQPWKRILSLDCREKFMDQRETNLWFFFKKCKRKEKEID